MQSRDFCYWLQGYFEIIGAQPNQAVPGLVPDQVDMIRKHLNMVFVHEIDPSMGGPEKQQALNSIHNNSHLTKPAIPGQPVARC